MASHSHPRGNASKLLSPSTKHRQGAQQAARRNEDDYDALESMVEGIVSAYRVREAAGTPTASPTSTTQSRSESTTAGRLQTTTGAHRAKGSAESKSKEEYSGEAFRPGIKSAPSHPAPGASVSHSHIADTTSRALPSPAFEGTSPALGMPPGLAGKHTSKTQGGQGPDVEQLFRAMAEMLLQQSASQEQRLQRLQDALCMTVVRAVTDAEIRIRADVLQSMNTAVRQVVTPGREVQAAGAQGEVHGTGEEDVASAHPVREAFPPKWMKEARVQTEAGASPSSPPAPAEGRGEVEVGHGKAGKAGDKGKEQEGTGGKGKTKSSIPAPSKPSRPLPPKKGSHTHSQSMQAAPATQEEGVQVEAHTAEVASGPEQAVQREEEQASAAVQDAPDSQADTAQPAPTPGAEGEGEGEGGQLAGKTTGSLFTSTRRGDPAAAHRARLAAARQKASLPPPSAAIMQVHPSLSSSHPHVVSRVQEGIRKGSAGSAGGAPAQPATHRGPDPGTRGGAAGTAESGREGPRTSPTPSPSTTTGRKPWSGTGGAAMSTSGRRTHSMPPTSKGLQAAPARGGPTASTVAADAKVEQPTEDTAFDATTAQTVEREGEGEREQQQDVGGGQSPELEAGQVKEAASSPPGSMSEETWARLTSTTAGRRRRCSACSEELDTSILGTTAADGHVHRAGKGDPWTQMEAGPSMTGKGQQQGDEGEGQEALVEADEGTADV